MIHFRKIAAQMKRKMPANILRQKMLHADDFHTRASFILHICLLFPLFLIYIVFFSNAGWIWRI